MMKIALAQINSIVGDLAGNVARCVAAVDEAAVQGADLVVLPEMAIPGYPPGDILCDPSFSRAVVAATADLAAQLNGAPATLVGTLKPTPHRRPNHPGLQNIAALLRNGNVEIAAVKRLLPGEDVFYEPRWFRPATDPSPPITIAGWRVGVLICGDIWDEGHPVSPAADALAAGAEILIVLNASPYRQNYLPQRLAVINQRGVPVVYVNLCGANDDLIFDGQSVAVNAAGALIAQLPAFQPAVQTVAVTDAPPIDLPAFDPPAELFGALVLGIRDFFGKNGVRHGVVGLSGGIDSAVVAVLATEALGPANVTAVAIPSRFTDPRSTQAARELAANLGIGFQVVVLDTLHTAAEDTLKHLLSDGGTTAENIQARLRGMILMSYVNRYGGILLNTSNKTELTLGYATLYGDMAGGLSPLGDVTKPEVYTLARWFNRNQTVIPPFIIQRPPSAELKAEQVDPFDYDRVAPQLEALVLANQSNPAMRRSEHKRRQMGVVLKVSHKAFGPGRMIPITRR